MWELIWKVVLVGILAIFTVMSVMVTILGARDIRRLLSSLRDAEDETINDH